MLTQLNVIVVFYAHVILLPHGKCHFLNVLGLPGILTVVFFVLLFHAGPSQEPSQVDLELDLSQPSSSAQVAPRSLVHLAPTVAVPSTIGGARGGSALCIACGPLVGFVLCVGLFFVGGNWHELLFCEVAVV